MAVFCIPRNLVEKLKESALKGEVDIKKLYKMSSEERRDFFTKFTNEELGKFINKEFEKAMVSSQKSALTDWAKSVFSPTSQAKPIFKGVIDKINALDELGVLSPKTEKAFLEDLVSDKLGVNVSPEEVQIISQKAQKINDAQVILGGDLGNPAKANETLKFFEARKDMDDYLKSLSPTPKLRVLTGTIGRGMMLLSLKSPILNIGSNIEVGFAEAITRRIADKGISGANNNLAIDYVKMVNNIYQKTGYDLSRMTSLNDSGTSGERVLGETVHAGGPGIIRKTGRIVEDIVFKQLMGAPDTAFSSVHFADSVNLNSIRLAKGDKIKATEMMNDAMRIEPQTAEGEVLRQQAIMDAEKATWTDSSWAAKATSGVRKIINDLSGDLRLGDFLFPFIKTPANVIATGMDYAGVGALKAIVKTVKAIRVGEFGSKEYIQGISKDLVRSGLGLTAAMILASQFDDDDFVGAYDPARAQIESLRNTSDNVFRVGNKWISTDWLGPISVPFSAMMFARKYGDTKSEKAYQYAAGVASQIKQLPGISDVFDYVKAQAYNNNQSLAEMTDAAKTYIVDQISARLLPSFISDLAKATDPFVRVAKKGFEALEAKIPGIRQTLPVKTNIFGEQIKTEPAWSTILFGSRVKTDQETEFIKEINKVSADTGKSISFTDWKKSSSKKLEQFKEKVGPDQYEKAQNEYGAELKKLLEQLLGSSGYKNLSDDDKLKNINDIDTKAQETIFKRYGFKFSTKSSVPLR